MGTLHYDDHQPVDVDDELLAHLAAVISTKFRRKESFIINWVTPGSSPETRSTMWLAASATCRFVYDSNEAHTLDRELFDRLMVEAFSNTGIVLEGVPEAPSQPAASGDLPG
jgi:hypothetical protein